MNSVFIIPIHSIAGTITSSSDEFYIFDKKHSVDFIREIIELALELYEKANDEKIIEFDEVFQIEYGKTKEGLGHWYKEFKDNIIIEEGVILRFEDNDIHWWIQEFLMDTFTCQRFHLG